MGNFNMLPLEIMLEIFSRLPAETVLDCKSVSKPWRDLVQHPSLSQMHLNRLIDSTMLSMIYPTKASNEEPFCYAEYDENLNGFTRRTRINLRPFENCYILGSCNGLIYFNASHDSIYPPPFYICNPITREYIILPKSEGRNFLTGFGYTPSTNEYKVVKISKYPRGYSNYGIIQVHTLGSGIGWRNVSKTDYDLRWFGHRGVFANGAIHWVDDKGTIVAFGLVDEELRQLPSPPCLTRPINIDEIHVPGDFLCGYYHHDGVFDIWVLKKNKSNMDGKPTSGELLCYKFRDKDVYQYPPKASSSRMLVNFGEYLFDGVCHKNTLVSLKALGEKDTKLMD